MPSSFPSFPFVVLDTETTGLFPRTDHILELALVRVEGGEVVAEYNSLYSVEGEIPSHVQVLTRIRPDDLAGKQPIQFDFPKIQKLLEGAVVVGHNVSYDLAMLVGDGFPLAEPPWLDSAMLASLLFPELESWSLGYLSTVLSLPHEPKHRALGDVHATLQLFAREWERLAALPKEMQEKMRLLAERGPEGYAALFGAVRESGKEIPSWVQDRKKKRTQRSGSVQEALAKLSLHTSSGEPELTLARVPASPFFLPDLLRSMEKASSKRWIAVKNLEATLRSLGDDLRKRCTILFPPGHMLEPSSRDALLAQSALTAPELTLGLKLLLFDPAHLSDLPIHSEEYDVWKAKIACTPSSPPYQKELGEASGTILLDHQQLLSLLQEGKGPQGEEEVIVDDASMLEDTATKASRWLCSLDVLRAGAEGAENELTRLFDLLELWAGRVRGDLTIRYLVEADLKTPEARGLRDRLSEVLALPLTEQMRAHLIDLQNILLPDRLEGRLAWLELFRDGTQVLQSVPENVASLLWEILYDRCSTLLLLPPGGRAGFPAIVPRQIDSKEISLDASSGAERPALAYADTRLTLDRLLAHADGKVIALLPSKRIIEQLFIQHTEALEARDIALIAQGFSGGQGRMQAEFLAAKSAIWLLTPWMYEGVELPEGTVDHLWIAALPFDHPSHAVLSRRAERFQKPFEEYLLPRLLHRLFRILRTYAGHRTQDAGVLMLDDRVRVKDYGVRVREYLKELTSE